MKTKAPANLIDLQTETIAELLALRENGRRAMGYRLTLLNKSGRSLGALRRRYVATSEAMGFTTEQALAQWQDVKDMAELEKAVS